MGDPKLDVSTLLRTVYHAQRPGNALAQRVQARVALLETLGEAMRLLVAAPASALGATLAPPRERGEGT